MSTAASGEFTTNMISSSCPSRKLPCSNVAPGVSQKDAASRRPDRFAALDDAAVQARLLDYADERRATATLAIPGIHCGSCVWLLERLWRFDAGISASEVDLVRRSVRVEFDPTVTSLRRVAEQAVLRRHALARGIRGSGSRGPRQRRSSSQISVGQPFGRPSRAPRGDRCRACERCLWPSCSQSIENFNTKDTKLLTPIQAHEDLFP